MNLEIFNKKEFLSKPNLDDHTIEYYSNVKGSRFDNVEFKGFIEFDYNENTRYSYYGQTSIDDKHIYLTVKTFEYNEELEDEKVDLERLIDNKRREYNRNSSNNISYSKEEIKDLLIPNINLDDLYSYYKEYKYFIFFRGCDDGSTFLRFNSEEKREAFLNKLLEFENFEDLFNYEEEDFVLFYFN